MRIVPLVLSLALMLAACSQSPRPSGSGSDTPPVVDPAPVAPGEPTPPPPVDEPVEPDPPTDAPVPPPGEEPPEQPVPPPDEPVEPSPPPEDPGEPTPPTDPEQPANISVTATPGGPAPWSVAYTWSAPSGAKVIHTCDGVDYGLSSDSSADCHHTRAGQGLILNVTLSDGTMFKQFVDVGVQPPKNGVPYYGTWTWTDVSGSLRSEFTINTKGNGVSGFNPDDSLWVTLLEDGRLDWWLDTPPFRLYAGESGEQVGTFNDGSLVQHVP